MIIKTQGKTHKTEFEFEDIVFLKTDPEQLERMITSLTVDMNGFLYTVACGDTESSHFECEITKDIKVI